jgi:uncharacterized membrane protein YcaP (DUF421 family)
MLDILHAFTKPEIGLLEKILRTLVVYVFLLIGLRVGGKRELGMLNPFDLVVLLVLSNTLQNAIIGPDNSVIGGLIGATTLLVINYLVVRFLFAHPKLERYVEGKAVILVADGKIQRKSMEKELITDDELRSRARLQGIDDLAKVRCARIEVGGALTFSLMTPSPEERWENEVRLRLDKIDKALASIAALTAKQHPGGAQPAQ